MRMNQSYLVRFLFAFLLSGMLSLVAANKVKFDQSLSLVCAGLYSKHDWGGSIKPHIGIKLTNYGDKKYDDKKKNNKHDKNISLSYVIFEYKDLPYIGMDAGDGKMAYICDDTTIEMGFCNKTQKGHYLTNSNPANSTVATSDITHLGPANVNYTIHKTGYYCVATYSLDDKHYSGLVNFQNAFGELSASEIPKLPAYGILTICYAICLALYGFQFYKKRNENQILPLQRYLLAMLGFLTFDTFVVWSYYDLVNRTKNSLSAFVIFYMAFLSIMNSIKITFCFFLLLCISLGYGVVVVKLPKSVMFKCKILAAAHFCASTFYLIATYYGGSSIATVSSDNTDANSSAGGLLDLIPLIPITITLSIYYIAIMISIRRTTTNLHKQRQVIKLNLYQNLFRIIFFSVVLTFGGLILSAFIFLSMSTTEMVEQHWRGAFFIFEFWPSIIFFAVFMCIAWLWRPTETSYMLAISQQVSSVEIPEDGNDEGQGYQQGNEFELDDLSLLSHSDNEDGRRNEEDDSFELSHGDNPPKYDQEDYSLPVDKSGEPAEASKTLFELGDLSGDEGKGEPLTKKETGHE